MVVRTSRRLPGFRFETQPPPLIDVLPRMDVTAFVGFAASGPLHTPVVVEDVAHFTTVFGDDIPLAWDQQRGQQVYGYLAPAVRAFFRNGGRRCWVVRVAHTQTQDVLTPANALGGYAQSNYFPIPGLAQVQVGKKGNIAPAFAQARSEGSWSDSLRVSSALLSQPAAVKQVMRSDLNYVVDLALASPNDIVVGDLLRLTFPHIGHDGTYTLMMVVDTIEPVPVELPPGGISPQQRNSVRITGTVGSAIWLKTVVPASPPPVAQHAFTFTRNTTLPHPVVVVEWPMLASDQTITLSLSLPPTQAPTPGSLLRVDFDAGQLWLLAQDVSVTAESSSPLSETQQVIGQGIWLVEEPPHLLPISQSNAVDGERLTFELWARKSDEDPMHLSGLGFAMNHPRFWSTLPTDTQLYPGIETTPGTPSFKSSQPVDMQPAPGMENFPETLPALWEVATNPRFPLAGSGERDVFYIPLLMPILPDLYLGPDRDTTQELPTELERDGLDQFNACLFLDPELITARTTELIAQADYIKYQAPLSRNLKGIHSLLDIEEVTMIAVPDAVHSGWFQHALDAPAKPQESDPLLHPEWWHARCNPPPNAMTLQAPPRDKFLACDIRIIDVPVFDPPGEPDQYGTFTLSWSSTLTDADVKYVLEESTSPDPRDGARIYVGKDKRVVIYGRTQGNYYYRVRAEVKGISSNWSKSINISIANTKRWQIQDVSMYSSSTLLAVQRALLRMCAARGDLLAVLGLPEHYREDDAVTHVTELKKYREDTTQVILPKLPPTSTVDDCSKYVDPLGFGETYAFTYGALYHPWLIGSEENQPENLRSTPPDGAMCGILALRTLTRGAWIAPANEVLQRVVALTPLIARERWLSLQEAQVNLIRQEPRGFISLSADTLSNDEDADLRPINVRRLLILLRRVALRLGATYVFEPNNDSFRRAVQRGFEDLLDQMFVRGAFAGSTPGTAFQVVTDNSVNTAQSIEQGKLIVDLRVAPSLPMTFLTVRLVQTGDRGLVSEVR